MGRTVAAEELESYYHTIKSDNDWKKNLNRLVKLRKEFIKKYPIKKIENFRLSDYVIGKGNQDSFCYDLENKYKELGYIYGSSSDKFGVYFGKKGEDLEKKYRIGKKALSDDVDIAFSTVKSEIIRLIKSEILLTQKEFKENLISPMIKLKILSIYHPTLYLSCFSDNHLANFADELGLLPENKDHLSLQKCLLDFKSHHEIFRDLSNSEFVRLLYEVIGAPQKNIKSKPINELILKKDLEEVPISDLDNIGVRLSTNFGNALGKTDYSTRERKNRITGALGEELVFNYEINKLIDAGRKDLANKVNQVSLSQDGRGYDIESYSSTGKAIKIEVKTSQSSLDKSSYFVTRNEYEIGKNIENYWIYIVSELKLKKPKLVKIENPFNSDSYSLSLEPTQYVFHINQIKH